MSKEYPIVERVIQSQTPVRDLAGVWAVDGKLICIMPVVAQCVVRVKSDTDNWNEVDFLTYLSGCGAELIGCRYSYPHDRFGECLLLPVSAIQWRRLFSDDPSARFAVANELGDEFGFVVTGWNA